MRITIRRQDERPRCIDATSASAEIDDAIRRSLFFTLSRHEVRADLLHVEIARIESERGVRHRCAITGAVEGLGVFRVWGDSDARHLALERALHRLEMWLVRERLAPRTPSPIDRPSVRRAA